MTTHSLIISHDEFEEIANKIKLFHMTREKKEFKINDHIIFWGEKFENTLVKISYIQEFKSGYILQFIQIGLTRNEIQCFKNEYLTEIREEHKRQIDELNDLVDLITLEDTTNT